MKALERIAIIACVSVVSLVLYALWLLRDLDPQTLSARAAKVSSWIDQIPAPAGTTTTSTAGGSALSRINVAWILIVGLFAATAYNLFGLKRS